jgi:hypothetical protein
MVTAAPPTSGAVVTTENNIMPLLQMFDVLLFILSLFAPLLIFTLWVLSIAPLHRLVMGRDGYAIRWVEGWGYDIKDWDRVYLITHPAYIEGQQRWDDWDWFYRLRYIFFGKLL